MIQDFIPVDRRNRPGIKLNGPKYITIHDTANPNKGADALAHLKYLKSDTASNIPVSWHFTVDDKQIVQHLPLDEVGWHAGDGNKGPGNTSSIGIEICENSDGNRQKAEENAAELVADLLKYFSLPIESVVQHNKWTGKNCPHILRSRPGGWEGFIERVKAHLQKQKDWKTFHVEWLHSQGYTDTARDPDQPVTWAELGVILKRHVEKGG